MSSNDMDPDPAALQEMRRMAFDRSKWLQTCTAEIAKYEYNKEELNQFFDELQDVIARVRSRFLCQMCNNFPKKTFVTICGHLFCQKCSLRSWNKEKPSKCPVCKEVSDEQATPLYAMDSVASDMNKFAKEAKFFQNPTLAKSNDAKDAAKLLKSMNFVLLQRCKNIESNLMCDFCFNRIKKTFLVNCSSNVFTFRPFCEGCDEKYIKFYQTEQGRNLRKSPQNFASFDEVVSDFYEFLTKVVDYSKSSKIPTRFVTSGSPISFWPIYKILLGSIFIGFILMYYSF